MKAKSIFLISIFSLLITLLNGVVFAGTTLRCNEVKMYCDYQGLFQDIDNADEEFAMLLEPSKHANFQAMFTALFYIAGCSEENQECMDALKNPDCNVSKYTQKLVDFYETNKEKIDDEEVIKVFEALRDSEGEIFFRKGVK